MKDRKDRYQTVNFVAAILIFWGIFVDLGYYNYILIFIGVLLFFLAKSHYYSSRKDQIMQFEKIGFFDGIDIALIPEKNAKTHHVTIFIDKTNKDHRILYDRLTKEAIENEGLEMVLFHEVGHLHTFDPDDLNSLQVAGGVIFGLFFHLVLYCDTCTVGMILGLWAGGILFIAASWLDQTIENKADIYAMEKGCRVESLIRAIKLVEDLNRADCMAVGFTESRKQRKRVKKLEKIKQTPKC